MRIISTKTTYRGVTMEVPRDSEDMTISIGEQSVTLCKWQAELLASYLLEEIRNMED